MLDLSHYHVNIHAKKGRNKELIMRSDAVIELKMSDEKKEEVEEEREMGEREMLCLKSPVSLYYCVEDLYLKV